MRKVIATLPITFAIALAGTARAQTSPTPPPPAVAGETAVRLSLASCVDAALRHNAEVAMSEEEVRAAEASRGQTAGQLGPKLHVDASAQRWNGPFNLPFALGPGPAVNFPVRDAFTWNASVSIIQPLTAFYAIYQQYKLKDAGVDIAAVRHEATRREITFRVNEAYFRLLQAERVADVAVTSVDQLTAQLKLATSFHQNGVVAKTDVLRAELGLASAKQRLIQARARVSFGRAQLAALTGANADATIDAEPLSGDPEIAPDVSLEQTEARALASRVELREIDRRIDQSELGVALAKSKLAPQISAVGTYQHTEGSQFAQKDAAFVGAVASWDVFEWGTTKSEISEAKSRTRQAILARTKVENDVRLDVRKAFLDQASARDAMEVSKTAVASAEENFRIVAKRYEANTATSFDVIDAESLLTQARAQRQNAIYDYLVARASLRHAVGD